MKRDPIPGPSVFWPVMLLFLVSWLIIAGLIAILRHVTS